MTSVHDASRCRSLVIKYNINKITTPQLLRQPASDELFSHYRVIKQFDSEFVSKCIWSFRPSRSHLHVTRVVFRWTLRVLVYVSDDEIMRTQPVSLLRIFLLICISRCSDNDRQYHSSSSSDTEYAVGVSIRSNFHIILFQLMRFTYSVCGALKKKKKRRRRKMLVSYLSTCNIVYHHHINP